MGGVSLQDISLSSPRQEGISHHLHSLKQRKHYPIHHPFCLLTHSGSIKYKTLVFKWQNRGALLRWQRQFMTRDQPTSKFPSPKRDNKNTQGGGILLCIGTTPAVIINNPRCLKDSPIPSQGFTNMPLAGIDHYHHEIRSITPITAF